MEDLEQEMRINDLAHSIRALTSKIGMMENRMEGQKAYISQLQQIVHSHQFGIDEVTEALANTQAGDNIEITRESTGAMTIYSKGGEGEWSFNHSKPANNQCKIAAGVINLGKGGDIEVAEATVNLTGNPSYVFVRVTYSTLLAEVMQSTGRPSTNASYFYLVLVKFTASGGVYDSGTILHRGDYFAVAIA